MVSVSNTLPTGWWSSTSSHQVLLAVNLIVYASEFMCKAICIFQSLRRFERLIMVIDESLDDAVMAIPYPLEDAPKCISSSMITLHRGRCIAS